MQTQNEQTKVRDAHRGVGAIELMLESHDEWDDRDLDERKRRARVADEKGKAWTRAVCMHSKYTCNHLYCHIGFAHLQVLIEHIGHLFCGDDAVLERGHQVYKRLKPITSGVGRHQCMVCVRR